MCLIVLRFLLAQIVDEQHDVRSLGSLHDLQPSASDVGDAQLDVLVLGLGGVFRPCLGGVLGPPDGLGCLQVFPGALSVLRSRETPPMFPGELTAPAISVTPEKGPWACLP